MARALTVHRATIPFKDRETYLVRVKARADYYASSGCRFWVFEDAAFPGAFLEFVEADSIQELSNACDRAPDPLLGAHKMYQQVEIQ